jgi:hypothetical protein
MRECSVGREAGAARGLAGANRRGAGLARVVDGGRASGPARLIAKLSSGRGESVISRLVGEVSKMPPETWPMVRAHWCQAKSFQGLAGLSGIAAGQRRRSECAHGPRQCSGDRAVGGQRDTEQLQEREGWRAALRTAGTSLRRRAGTGYNSTNRSWWLKPSGKWSGLIRPS